MTPLRWTILATQVPPGGSLGGIVRYTTELIRALAARDDVIVSAVTTRAGADTVRELVGDRSRVQTVPDLPVPLLSITERHLPVRGAPADVVHGVKHLVPHRCSGLRVLTVHDMLLLDRPADFGMAKRAMLPAAYRGSIRDADLLLCVSEATRRRMAAHAPGAAQRSAVVHLATSPSLRNAVPRAVNALRGRRFALVIGDTSPRKNLRTVVEAWPKVRAAQPDAVLAVAGPPSWGRSVVGDTFAAGVADGSIIALQQLDDAELRWAYEHAAVVLCPSLAEGFGLPAAEALDLGAPVIISNDAALQEVSAGRALAVLPATDGDGWAVAVVAALGRTGRRRPVGTWRSWDDVADDTVAAVRRSMSKPRG